MLKEAVVDRERKKPRGGKFALVGYCLGDKGEKKHLCLYDRKGDDEVRLPEGVREKLHGAES